MPPRKRRKSSLKSEAEERIVITPAFESFIKRRPAEPVDKFLARARPTTTPSTRGDWIYAQDPAYTQLNDSLEQERFAIREGSELLMQFEMQLHQPRLPLSLSANPISFIFGDASATTQSPLTRSTVESKLYAIAEKHGFVSGKWLLFPAPRNVDAVWAKIARATFERRLGTAAKVATNKGTGSTYVICVYCRDFTDREDVGRVLRVLREDLGLTPVAFKSDLFTMLHLTGDRNRWGLKTSRYTIRDFPGVTTERAFGTAAASGKNKVPIEDYFLRLGNGKDVGGAALEAESRNEPTVAEPHGPETETMMEEVETDSPVLNEIHHNTSTNNSRASQVAPQIDFLSGGPQPPSSLSSSANKQPKNGTARRSGVRSNRGSGRRQASGRTTQSQFREEDPFDF